MTETSFSPEDLQKGAQNLLLGCVGMTSGDEVLVVREDPGPGYYDGALITGEDLAARYRVDHAEGESIFADRALDPKDFPEHKVKPG